MGFCCSPPLPLAAPLAPATTRADPGATPQFQSHDTICNSPHQRIGVRAPDLKNGIKYFIKCYISYNRRLGGESDREISMAPACVILSLGLWSLISAPVARACPWARFVSRNEIKNCSVSSWNISGACWMSSGDSWRILVSFC